MNKQVRLEDIFDFSNISFLDDQKNDSLDKKNIESIIKKKVEERREARLEFRNG